MNLKTRIKELAAKAEAAREFATGDQIFKLGVKAANARGVYRPEALAMAGQLHGPILATALTKKGGAWNKAQRKASAYQIREYRGVLRRGKERANVTEFARGDYAIPALGKMLRDRSLLEEFLTGKRGPKLGDLSVGKIYPGGKISALRPPKKSDFHISGWTKGQMLGTEPVGPQNARWRDALIEERIRRRKENFKKNRDSLSDVVRNVPLDNFPALSRGSPTAVESAFAQSARTAARNNVAKMLRKGRAGGDVYEDIYRKFFCRATTSAKAVTLG